MREPIKILIHLEGGCITGIACSLANPEGIEVMIADHDDDEELGTDEVEAFAAECPTWIA